MSGREARAAASSLRYWRYTRKRSGTTSSRPTTAKLAASTTVRTPAARRWGPVEPKNSAPGYLRRSSSTTSEA